MYSCERRQSRRRAEDERADTLFRLRATTMSADYKRDARAALNQWELRWPDDRVSTSDRRDHSVRVTRPPPQSGTGAGLCAVSQGPRPRSRTGAPAATWRSRLAPRMSWRGPRLLDCSRHPDSTSGGTGTPVAGSDGRDRDRTCRRALQHPAWGAPGPAWCFFTACSAKERTGPQSPRV